MSMSDQIAKLEARMNAASIEGDFETAALLRDAIGRIRSGDSNLMEQVPGKMGLGTSQENYLPDGRRARPKKPDPMVSNHKPAGGGRR